MSGWAVPGNRDSSLQFPSFLSLFFLTTSCHVWPFASFLLHLNPYNMERTITPGTLTIYVDSQLLTPGTPSIYWNPFFLS